MKSAQSSRQQSVELDAIRRRIEARARASMKVKRFIASESSFSSEEKLENIERKLWHSKRIRSDGKVAVRNQTMHTAWLSHQHRAHTRFSHITTADDNARRARTSQVSSAHTLNVRPKLVF